MKKNEPIRHKDYIIIGVSWFILILMAGCSMLRPSNSKPVDTSALVPKLLSKTQQIGTGNYFTRTNNWLYFYTNGVLAHVTELCTNCPVPTPTWTGINGTGITALAVTSTNCTIQFVEDGSLMLERSLYLKSWNIIDATQSAGTNTFTDTNVFGQAFYRLAPLNVADFGAQGDAANVNFLVISNDEYMGISNGFVLPPVPGKVLEIFGAGPSITWNNQTVVTQQDLICRVQGSDYGLNYQILAATAEAGRTGTFAGTVGTENSRAFQAAIAAAVNVVNNCGHATIEIPNGTYLLASSNVQNPGYVMNSISDTHPALTISSGGITFHGETNTVLLGIGAGMEHSVNSDLSWISPFYAPYVPMRDTLIIFQAPVGHPELPLRFENITFDGGVQQGQQSYNYWIINQADGSGWDTTHHALADNAGPYNTPGYLQMNSLKVFTNCVFQHWRGEMCICWTGQATNCASEWDNCIFRDGNATADNMYYGQTIRSCTFDGVGKVLEYYQANGGPSLMENCLITNISELAGPGNTHIDCTVTGATTNGTMPPFIFRNNKFYDNVGMEFFSLNAGENISFISNSFAGSGPGINLTGIGQQPSDGSQAWYMTNILLLANQFSCSGPLSIGFGDVQNLYCSNNIGFSVSASIGFATNIILSGNIGYNMGNDYYDVMSGPIRPGDVSQISTGQYMQDLTNNQWVVSTPFSIDGGSPFATNFISYGNGRIHKLQASGAIFYLDDRFPNLIPPNAVLQVNANTWDGHNVTNFFLSDAVMGNPITITNGTSRIFQWISNRWQ